MFLFLKTIIEAKLNTIIIPKRQPKLNHKFASTIVLNVKNPPEELAPPKYLNMSRCAIGKNLNQDVFIISMLQSIVTI